MPDQDKDTPKGYRHPPGEGSGAGEDRGLEVDPPAYFFSSPSERKRQRLR